ncbi:MAG: DMT family transporter [Verrucomicrobia bacterium]|nr:DMT family transporter [Verrucomicrobiota bacterium]
MSAKERPSSRRGSRVLNLVLLVAVNLMWAAQYPAYKVASDHMDDVTLNFWTFLLAALFLIPFLVRSGRPRTRFSWSICGDFLVLAIFGLLPPSVCLSWGIAHSSASNASLISLTIPVLMVIMAVIMLGEHMTPLRWISISAALLGTLVISRISVDRSFFASKLLAGNVVIFLAGAGSAFYNAFGKKLLARFSEMEVLIYGYVFACAACGALSAAFGARPFYRVTGYPFSAWLGILVLGGLSWGLAMALWMWVLNQLDLSQISASVYLLPLFGVILSAMTLHEKLTLVQIFGGLIVLFATYLTSTFEDRRRRQTQV